MAVNIRYKQFPEFDLRKDPATVYARFVKYAERFKNNHLKACNITDKAQQRSLFLDSMGEATLHIFEQLGDTGTDLDGAMNALRNKFRESQNRLLNIHKFRCIKQGKDETWDLFISKLRAEGEHRDFPTGWLDTEILMAMIENGKSKRVRRKLLQDQLTLAEALKYARGLESADQHATKVENQAPTEVTVKQEVDKITADRIGENRVLIAENIGHIKGDQENVRLLEGSVRDVGEQTISQSVAKASKKLKPRGI